MGNWDARRVDLFSASCFILRHISAARTIPLVVGWEPGRVAGRGLSSSPAGTSMSAVCPAHCVFWLSHVPSPRLGFL